MLVEGGRDRAALVELGIPPEGIFLVNRGSSLVCLSESLAKDGRRVIVLTDWDGTGTRLATRLSKILHSSGVATDTEARRNLAHVLCREILEVENLHTWAERESALHKVPFHEIPLASQG